MSKLKKETESPGDFKNHWEAIQKADELNPRNQETLNEVQQLFNIADPKDVQMFVIFNMLRGISNDLNKSVENTHLNRVQQNIMYSTFQVNKRKG